MKKCHKKKQKMHIKVSMYNNIFLQKRSLFLVLAIKVYMYTTIFQPPMCVDGIKFLKFMENDFAQILEIFNRFSIDF